MTLEQHISLFVIIGERYILHTLPLDRVECWFWKPLGQAPYRRNRPRKGQANGPSLTRHKKTLPPFRHFYPDVPTEFRLGSTTCGHNRGTICVNPWHRIVPKNCAPQVYCEADGLWHTAVDPMKAFFTERKRLLLSGELADWNDPTGLTPQQLSWLEPADAD
jgi:hypothetical protein